jgi:hypothetical protein
VTSFTPSRPRASNERRKASRPVLARDDVGPERLTKDVDRDGVHNADVECAAALARADLERVRDGIASSIVPTRVSQVTLAVAIADIDALGRARAAERLTPR